jgi:hypothetical protein
VKLPYNVVTRAVFYYGLAVLLGVPTVLLLTIPGWFFEKLGERLERLGCALDWYGRRFMRWVACTRARFVAEPTA